MHFYIYISFFMLIHSYLGFSSTHGGDLAIYPTAPHNVYLYKPGDSLNLTCVYKAAPGDLPEVHLEWQIPVKALNWKHRVEYVPYKNTVKMIIKNLQDNDSGEYKCIGSSNINPDLMIESAIRVNIKNKRQTCPEMMYQCGGNGVGAEVCIPKRYTCDGFADCKGGDDESEGLCGAAPCSHKLACPDGRCIPHAWCCAVAEYSHGQNNCTHTATLPCCFQSREAVEDSYMIRDTHQRLNDVAFFRTTVYTVIGCALTFMCFVTILVIAICRVHMKRTRSQAHALSHRAAAITDDHWDAMHPCSRYFMTTANPLLITYNINNGVQCIVGRPVDPPPYCEVVTSPPREGPPPAYTSRENLSSNTPEGQPLLNNSTECSIAVISDQFDSSNGSDRRTDTGDCAET